MDRGILPVAGMQDSETMYREVPPANKASCYWRIYAHWRKNVCCGHTPRYTFMNTIT